MSLHCCVSDSRHPVIERATVTCTQPAVNGFIEGEEVKVSTSPLSSSRDSVLFFCIIEEQTQIVRPKPHMEASNVNMFIMTDRESDKKKKNNKSSLFNLSMEDIHKTRPCSNVHWHSPWLCGIMGLLNRCEEQMAILRNIIAPK